MRAVTFAVYRARLGIVARYIGLRAGGGYRFVYDSVRPRQPGRSSRTDVSHHVTLARSFRYRYGWVTGYER